jgi:septation ring formation regulator EzrA
MTCTILGWFARELYAATQSLRQDLSALEVRIGSDYIRYDRLQDAMKPIMDSLTEIKHALDKKADKP